MTAYFDLNDPINNNYFAYIALLIKSLCANSIKKKNDVKALAGPRHFESQLLFTCSHTLFAVLLCNELLTKQAKNNSEKVTIYLCTLLILTHI